MEETIKIVTSEIAKKIQKTPDCVAVKVYVLKKDCNSCSFECGEDHGPWCKFDDRDKIYAGKPFCKYLVDYRFVPLEKLKDTDCVNFDEVSQDCKERCYNHACAIKCNLGSSSYLDDIHDIVSSISQEEAEQRMYELTGRLSLQQVKELKEGQEVRIVDSDCNTTWPPHRTDKIYRVLSADSENLRCASQGYSSFDFEDYGEDWIAYAILSKENK